MVDLHHTSPLTFLHFLNNRDASHDALNLTLIIPVNVRRNGRRQRDKILLDTIR